MIFILMYYRLEKWPFEIIIFVAECMLPGWQLLHLWTKFIFAMVRISNEITPFMYGTLKEWLYFSVLVADDESDYGHWDLQYNTLPPIYV